VHEHATQPYPIRAATLMRPAMVSISAFHSANSSGRLMTVDAMRAPAAQVQLGLKPVSASYGCSGPARYAPAPAAAAPLPASGLERRRALRSDSVQRRQKHADATTTVRCRAWQGRGAAPGAPCTGGLLYIARAMRLTWLSTRLAAPASASTKLIAPVRSAYSPARAPAASPRAPSRLGPPPACQARQRVSPRSLAGPCTARAGAEHGRRIAHAGTARGGTGVWVRFRFRVTQARAQVLRVGLRD